MKLDTWNDNDNLRVFMGACTFVQVHYVLFRWGYRPIPSYPIQVFVEHQTWGRGKLSAKGVDEMGFLCVIFLKQ